MYDKRAALVFSIYLFSFALRRLNSLVLIGHIGL